MTISRRAVLRGSAAAACAAAVPVPIGALLEADSPVMVFSCSVRFYPNGEWIRSAVKLGAPFQIYEWNVQTGAHR